MKKPNKTVHFTDKSEGGDGAVIAKRLWQFFDKDGATKIGESSEPNPAFTFPSWGKFFVNLTVINECGRTASTGLQCISTGEPKTKEKIKKGFDKGWKSINIIYTIYKILSEIVDYFSAKHKMMQNRISKRRDKAGYYLKVMVLMPLKVTKVKGRKAESEKGILKKIMRREKRCR